MTILTDVDTMQEISRGLITPYEPELLNPASYDITLGPDILVEKMPWYQRVFLPFMPIPRGKGMTDDWRIVSIAQATKEEPYYLRPGHFILASSEQKFSLPKNIAAELRVKSSRAREGYNNVLAVWCDPGWKDSELTLELFNVSRFYSVPLYPGLKVGQMIFHQLSDYCHTSYEDVGRYNQQRGPLQSRG